MESAAAPSSSTSHKAAHTCAGVAYFDAFRRSSGLPPVCIGVSSLRTLEATVPTDNASAPSAGFKSLCIGFTMHQEGAGAMPRCEGIELMLIEEEVQADAAQPQASSSGKPSTQHRHMATSLASAHQQPSTSTSAAAKKEEERTLFRHLFDRGQDYSSTAHPPETGTPVDVLFRFCNQLGQNADKLEAALLRNEGPIRMKPLPGSVNELYNKLMANSEKNLGSMRDVANSVVKPVLVLLGYSTK